MAAGGILQAKAPKQPRRPLRRCRAGARQLHSFHRAFHASNVHFHHTTLAIEKLALQIEADGCRCDAPIGGFVFLLLTRLLALASAGLWLLILR
jgi:hypothetical protein